MNWEALGAIAEALGAVGVIVTLAYLATQIRQNSKLLRASTSSTSTTFTFDFTSLLVQDAAVARVFWSGMADRSALSDEDRARFDPLMGMYFTGFNQEHAFAADGVMSAAVFESRRRNTLNLLARPGTRQWWREWRGIYDDRFQEMIDDLIREIEAPSE